MAKVYSKISLKEIEGKSILNVNEVALFLDCCPRTIWTLIKSNKLLSFRVGSLVKIRRADLDAFIDMQMAVNQ